MTIGSNSAPPGPSLLAALDEAAVALAIFAGHDLVLQYATPAYQALFPALRPGMSARAALSDPQRKLVLELALRVLESGEPALHTRVEIDDERLCELSLSPLRGDDATTGVLVVATDVTSHIRELHEVEAERERLLVIDHATQAVAAEVEPRRELAALAASVVPSLADACAIYLCHPPQEECPSDSWTRLACVVDKRLGVTPPRAGVTVTLSAGSVMAQAVRQRRIVVAKAAAMLTNEEPWLSALPVTSLVAVPVMVDDTVLAVVTYVTADSRPPFRAADISLLREITARATVSVDHALQLQRTTEVSLALQRGFLSEPPSVPGLRIAVRYRPAGAGLEIGGDWYDALVLPSRSLAVTIGDVVGHDLPAATAMAQIRSMLRALACQHGSTPARVLTELNQITEHLAIGSCATLIYGDLTRRGDGTCLFRWANAGHPAPLLLDGSLEFLIGPRQPLLGLLPVPYYEDSRVLAPGSTLLFFTDGLIEHRRDATDPLGELLKYAGTLGDLPPEELVAALDDWAPSEDDLALLAVRLDDAPA